MDLGFYKHGSPAGFLFCIIRFSFLILPSFSRPFINVFLDDGFTGFFLGRGSVGDGYAMAQNVLPSSTVGLHPIASTPCFDSNSRANDELAYDKTQPAEFRGTATMTQAPAITCLFLDLRGLRQKRLARSVVRL